MVHGKAETVQERTELGGENRSMSRAKEGGIRTDAKLSELYPTLQTTFDYRLPAPAAPVEEPGGQEASAEDPEESLTSVAIQFPGLDHLVVILFDPVAAEEARASYPGAALWSMEAFKRFLDDACGLSDLARRRLIVSANLVKSVLGGSYQGVVVREPPPKRKR